MFACMERVASTKDCASQRSFEQHERRKVVFTKNVCYDTPGIPIETLSQVKSTTTNESPAKDSSHPDRLCDLRCMHVIFFRPCRAGSW